MKRREKINDGSLRDSEEIDNNKVVRALISPNKKKMKMEVNKIMNPEFLLGTAFNIAYWHRKYHSGTICKGVNNVETSDALSGCENIKIKKLFWNKIILI